MAYVFVFAGGLAGSLHCVGMCGGFPLALAGGGRSNLSRQLLYNLGRLNTLVAIGALSGGLGAAAVSMGPIHVIERALAIVAGLIMMSIGLEMLGVLGSVTARGAALAHATVGRALASTIRSRSAAAPLALGIFNAFLPCQLIYAFAAQAASTASVGAGMLTMLAFGAGTLPAMLAVGTTRGLVPAGLRMRLTSLSAVLVLAFGVVTLLRGCAGPELFGHVGHAH